MKKKLFRIGIIPAVAALSFLAFSSFVDSDESGDNTGCTWYCKSDPNYKCIITWSDGSKTTCDKQAKQ
jgi:hypothetical protein